MAKSFDIEKSLESLVDKLSGWLNSLIVNLPNIILAVLVFILFIFTAKWIGKFVNRLLIRKVKQDSIREITIKVLKAIIILTGFFVALGLLNLNKLLTSILAGAGVIGLAVGLALQGPLNNSFSGVILSFLPELQIGDWVETNGYAGTVVEINLRSIKVRQSDNNFVVIPNSKIVNDAFKNYSRTERSRIFVNCGVHYSSDLEMVKKLTTDTIAELFPQNGEEEVEFLYNEFADSSINFTVRFWTDARKNFDILAAQSRAIIAIKKAFDNNDINIPFPIRTIDFSNNLSLDQSKETDKD
ncbi:mechanosensitive ion channel family protein [Zunongwangia profunda]|jgi:small conductance mechanosensitive channel|uniref:Small-conductance mechanosensitive ion channel protein n=2 Tax=Zunongwangia profunda TaxID=398743 RepID=D5BBX6_ZUNPS|nr:mechanosensitive ion channel family protein [Zunongwangia profunda]MAG87864.1 mechanosensitive ion channel family protein [Flavobacteriaceae bacterium]MAS72647.1 mechanosensitive ion channel family protein [Zunongwangia sp.]ADF52575.1 small-conductance mechanosensitive ion channel protein [Zunongwangia profunda SM-A87]HAJ81857.1 mechanosensitive ion channel family protein [Zunongwangia profunda]HCV81616.1 mechanosensitive ion channel family protein [Zunongwangia profunda]|tara:strand:- start:19 stop:915 length:897 start_codon:yes stop_codon:yes gene_type:complete